MSETNVTDAPRASARAALAGTARPVDLLYSETETELRAAVRALLEDKAGWRDVLARTETAETYDTGLWRTLAAEVGCAGLLIPESLGGAGASYREAAVVAEELGRSIAPVPFLGSAVIATTALLAAGDDELLTELAGGAVTAALAIPFAAGPAAAPATTVRLDAAQRRRRGRQLPADRHAHRAGRRAARRRAAGARRWRAVRPVRGAGC